MDSNDMTQFTPSRGMSVYGSDEDKVGEIDAVETDHFVVRKGFFFPDDHIIPMSAIATYDDESVYLNVTKEQAMEQQWGTGSTGGYATTTAVTEEPLSAYDTSASTGDMTQTLPDDDLTRTDAAYADVDRTQVRDDDTINVQTHEEELVAGVRGVDRGDVRVRKDVVSEEREIEVPVTEERVQVNRVTVDRAAAPGETAFEEGTIEVPVYGEEVDVEKRARVTGEVEISKTAETHTERVRDNVRREEVTIEGEDVNDTNRKR